MAVAPLVAVRGLSKRYRKLVALDDVCLDVHAGEVVGLLGPNGAGKTTLLEIIEGVRKPTSGVVLAFGQAPLRSTKSVRAKIGVQLQCAPSYRPVTVGELLDLWVCAYGQQTNTEALLRLVGLSSRAQTRLGSLSAGQQQRLTFAAALAGNPQLLILDEPTSNLDPQSRRRVWSEIKERATNGTAVLFATHQLDEAEQFCDRVVIIDHGRIVAAGTPMQLVHEHFAGMYTVELTIDADDVDLCRDVLRGDVSVDATDGGQTQVSWRSSRAGDAINELSSLAGCNVKMAALHVRQRSLGDVFIQLTGAELRA